MKRRIALTSLLGLMLLIVVACAIPGDPGADPSVDPAASANRAAVQAGAVPEAAPAMQAGAGQVEVEAYREQVTLLQGGVEEELPWNQTATLAAGDGVNVDEQGLARINFDPLPLLELSRAGQLVVSEQEPSVLTRVSLHFGALFSSHRPTQPGDVLSVETDYAIVKVTGTELLVVRENNTPLEWVLTLDAHTTDAVTVASKSGTAPLPVPSGLARWIAPIGEPGPEVPFDQAAVTAWLQQVRDGAAVPEIGRVLWPTAALTSTMRPIESLPPMGEPFALEGVTLTLESGAYELEDCNGDGIEDVALKNGVLRMDFRGLLARVGYLETDVINRAAAGTGWLRVFNPAYDPIDVNLLDSVPGQTSTLRLDADQPLNLPADQLPGQPYHYAELALSDGCFIRFGTTPASPAAGPSQPGEAEICRPMVGGLFLRSGPGEEEPAIGTVGRGAAMAATGRSADGAWIAVRTADGRTGWVAASLVACEAGTLPPATPAPACVRRRPAGWGTYQVRPGDTLSAIAQRSCGSVAAIAQANCIEPSRIVAGTVLVVPACPEPQASEPVTGSETLPDLVITTVTPGKQSLLCRDSEADREPAVVLPVNAVLTNRGAATAGPSVVLVEALFGEDERARAWVDVGRVLPGRSLSLPAELRLPVDAQGASITLRAMADSCEGEKGGRNRYCRVLESNETNNWSPEAPVTALGNRVPEVKIVIPPTPDSAECACQVGENEIILCYAEVQLLAEVFDCEDGALPNVDIVWTVYGSQLSGGSEELGEGQDITATLDCSLPDGAGREAGDLVQTIVVTATDSAKATAAKTHRITLRWPIVERD